MAESLSISDRTLASCFSFPVSYEGLLHSFLDMQYHLSLVQELTSMRVWSMILEVRHPREL